MTKEDKELLLRDLCCRLPYGVIVKTYWKDTLSETCVDVLTTYDISDIKNPHRGNLVIKPYLRPMSSMTEEEKEKVELLCDGLDIDDEGNSFHYLTILKNRNSNQINTTIIDWLNAHHFDYRSLIEKGLALEAPEGMYN